MKTGWVSDGTNKYYMEEAAGENHGKMSFGFKKISGKTYFFNEQGHMVKGWLKSNDKYYYFDEEGKIVAGKSITIEGKEYTFDEHGVCTNLSGTPSSVTNAIPGILKSESRDKKNSNNPSKSGSSDQAGVVPAPNDNKPGESKAGESKPSESKPSESKPGESKSGESKKDSNSSKEPTVPAAPTDESKSQQGKDNKSDAPSGEAKPKSPSDETQKGNGSTGKDEVGLKPGETSGPK